MDHILGVALSWVHSWGQENDLFPLAFGSLITVFSRHEKRRIMVRFGVFTCLFSLLFRIFRTARVLLFGLRLSWVWLFDSSIVQVEKRAAFEFGSLWLCGFLLILTCPTKQDVILSHVRRDCQQVAGIACKRLAHFIHLKDLVEVLLWKLRFQDEKEILKVCEGVRLEVTEEHDVVFVFESVAEAERVEVNLHGLFRLEFVTGNHLVVPVVVRLHLK